MPKSVPARMFRPAVWIVAAAVLGGVGIVGAANRNTHPATAKVKATTHHAPPALSAKEHGRIRTSLSTLPLAFEANQGQTDPQVKYMARGGGYKLFLTSSQAIMTLPARKRWSEVRDMMLNKRRGAARVKSMLKKRAAKQGQASSAAVLRMNLLGPNSRAQLAPEDLQPSKVNYFLGNDPSKWHSNIPLYARVSYRNVYPGVDLAFHGASERLEFDYQVSPGANPAAIALSLEDVDSAHIDSAGNLVLATSAGAVQLNRPVAYQSKDGGRELVDAAFVLKGKNEVAFALGSYDHNRELVIDPTVTYSTYMGGDGADYGLGIAVDASGNTYVAGATDSASILGGSPTNFDIFVAKIDPSGAQVFLSHFGGSGDDFPGGIAVDSTGIYLAGTTDSSDFPVTAGAAQTGFMGGVANGNNDAFAVKLTLDGTAIAWGTFIAGSDSDSGLGISVDAFLNAYVVGETFSTDLGGTVGGVNPLPNGGALNLGTSNLDDDGYIVKLNSTGTAYSLVSYLGGSSGDIATGVSVNSSGNIYVSGDTISVDLPATSGVVQGTCGTDSNCNTSASGAQDDAFAVSIKANLSGYNYVTYYGGNGADDALAVAADAAGNAFLTGDTTSSDFPTAGAPFQSTLFGPQNAFVLELNSSGTVASYSTYFGGDGSDTGLAVALDGSHNIYFTGQTTSSSSTFPLLNATQPDGSGSSDAFVSVFGLSQNQLLFSTFLGGGGDEDQLSAGIGVDSSKNIYVTGDTDSGNGSTAPFPTTAGAIDTTYGGGTCTTSTASVPCTDAFVAAYSPATLPDFALSAGGLSPSSVSPGGSATSSVTITDLNGYTGTVNIDCAVTGGGSPLPACSLTSTNPSTLTVTTTGAAAAMYRPSNILYAMWLPVVGLSLVGMRFRTSDSRKKRLLNLLLFGFIMAALFLLPACGGGGHTGGGCSGCTPAGNYTVTVTGTDSVNTALTHSVAVTLTVN